MTGNFDAYHKWLGIPPKDQPPDHYRLLGIELFESDPDVISSAADQRMAHIRSFQIGRNSDDSQKILNEIAAARLCLLNHGSRVQYDDQLRKQLQIGQDAVGWKAIQPVDSRLARLSQTPMAKTRFAVTRQTRIWLSMGMLVAAIVVMFVILTQVGNFSHHAAMPDDKTTASQAKAPKPADPRRTREVSEVGNSQPVQPSREEDLSETSDSSRIGRSPIELVRRLDIAAKQSIREVAFLSGQRVLCAVGDDLTIRLLNLADGRTLRRIPGYCFAVSPDEQSVITGDNEGIIRVVQLASGDELLRWSIASAGRYPSKAIWHLRVSMDGQRVLSNGADGRIRVWEASSGKMLMEFTSRSQFMAIAVSPDWRYLTACDCNDKRDVNNKPVIRRWDLDTQKEIGSLLGHKGSIRCLTFSSDGRKLLSASGPRRTMKGTEELVDCTLRLWDWDTGREIRKYVAHYGSIDGCQLSPDDRFILSAGDDRTIRLWNVGSGTLMHTTATPMDPVRSMAFSPDGRQVISAHGDLIKVAENRWKPSSDICLRLWSISDVTENE